MTLSFLRRFINHDAVLRLLIRLRCKEAEKRQKRIVVDSMAVSDGRKWQVSPGKQELYAMFPPRRKWVHSSYQKRERILPNGEHDRMTQTEKNERNLLITVRKEADNKGVHPQWYILLEERISHIVQAAFTGKRLFSIPQVTVIEKKRKGDVIECRPICTFKSLDERLIVSLYNKVLTSLFDPYFYENSFAFRIFKEGDAPMAHLNAVRKIKEFRKHHTGVLWVAECDMKKFYDTIDHDIIKQRFMQLLLPCKQDGTLSCEEFHILKRVMFNYVDCFSFWRDVYKYNSRPKHPIWRNIKDTQGKRTEVKWVLEEIETLRQSKDWKYRTKSHYKYQLGVPQGGALSGVIANIILHFTDQSIRKYWLQDPNSIYVRFCDDMIMIGESMKHLADGFSIYQKSIRNSHLFMHDPEKFTDKKMKGFWEGKTRLPYPWGQPSKDVFPWITFVGYDFNWNGDTRIRRSSVRKEIKKQYEKYAEIHHLLAGKNRRNPKWTLYYIHNSVRKRMIGMSVGRVQIWNYKSFGNKFSWAKAFTELTNNSWSRKQLKQLDRHRKVMLRKLYFELEELDYKENRPSDKKESRHFLPHYSKPFSYYGQVLKDW